MFLILAFGLSSCEPVSASTGLPPNKAAEEPPPPPAAPAKPKEEEPEDEDKEEDPPKPEEKSAPAEGHSREKRKRKKRNEPSSEAEEKKSKRSKSDVKSNQCPSTEEARSQRRRGDKRKRRSRSDRRRRRDSSCSPRSAGGKEKKRRGEKPPEPEGPPPGHHRRQFPPEPAQPPAGLSRLPPRPGPGSRRARPMAMAAAKAHPKAMAAVRRRGRRLARPAAVVDPVPVAPLRHLNALSVAELGRLETILLEDALYYGKKVDLVGKVLDARLEGGHTFLIMEGCGTRDDGVLRMLSGKEDRKVQVHVCDDRCDGLLTDESLLHGRSFKEVSLGDEGWYSNAVKVPGRREEDVDELARLREAAQEKKTKEEAAPAAREDEELELGQAPLGIIFKGSGLDPNTKVRNSLTKKARKNGKKKKKKKKSSDSSSKDASTSSTSSTEGLEGNASLFDTERKLKLIHRKFPGVLAGAALGEIRRTLLTTSGTLWDIEKGRLPPIFTQYMRQQLSGVMAPAMLQEALTLGQTLDGLLQGRVAGACDLLCQRLKSLESTSRGAH
eukprot:Skav224368  [mRNA]  locus=scaffold4379:25491:27693:- [translate_table: standard]